MFPEYAVFVYDAVTTVAMGIQAVLKDAVPEWLGGSTAIPTEYFALYLTLTLLWMAFSFVVGTWLEHWDVHRLSHKGVVVIFGIIAGVLIRTMGSGMSAVGLME